MSQELTKQQQEPKGMFLRVRDYAEENFLKVPLQFLGKYGVTPDRISLARFPGALASLAVHNVNDIAGTTMYLANSVLDWCDGASARHNPHLATKEGARFDSLVDKGIMLSTYAYLVQQGADNPLVLSAMAANAGLDIFSALQRGNIVEQVREGIDATLHPESHAIENPAEIEHMKANVLGKIKFILQTASVSTLLAAGNDEKTQMVAGVSLLVAAALGSLGLRKRQKIQSTTPEDSTP